MLMITGCRRGEIVGMKWSNVNWEDSSILINSATPSAVFMKAPLRPKNRV